MNGCREQMRSVVRTVLNDGKVFSTGGRAEQGANSLEFGRCFESTLRKSYLDVLLNYIYPCPQILDIYLSISTPNKRKNFTHCPCAYCTRNVNRTVELQMQQNILKHRRIIIL